MSKQLNYQRAMRNMATRFERLFGTKSFAGETVLDLGCNAGGVCEEAVRRGATRAVGLDVDAAVVARAARVNRLPGVEFHRFDLDDGLPPLMDLIGIEPFDHVFALSILKHVDEKALLDAIGFYARTSCWIEFNPRLSNPGRVAAVCGRVVPRHRVVRLEPSTDRRSRAVVRLDMTDPRPAAGPGRFRPPPGGKIGYGESVDPAAHVDPAEVQRAWRDESRRAVDERAIVFVDTAALVALARRRHRRPLRSWWKVPELGRAFTGVEKLSYLRASMRDVGWDPSQPAHVRIRRDGVRLRNGHHRVRVARELGIERVPCSFTYVG